jgi:hypothetical protein
MLISCTISTVTLTFDIEGHVIHIGFDIGYRYAISLSQYHSLRSRSSLCPGSITLAPKSLSATCPGFLLNPSPSFAQFHSSVLSLLHRDLTRKGPSIAPHPHVEFEQPAPSPTVESRICCSFFWDLSIILPLKLRGIVFTELPFTGVQVTWNQRHMSKPEDVCRTLPCSISNIKHQLDYSIRYRVRYHQYRT